MFILLGPAIFSIMLYVPPSCPVESQYIIGYTLILG